MILRNQEDDSPTYANLSMMGSPDFCESRFKEQIPSPPVTIVTMQSQYRDPPPYPGHSKQLYQPGLRQSFSGSETSTDVSVSSTENLSTSQRQEPQGEENQSQPILHQYDLNNLNTGDSDYSILARLMPSSGMEVKTSNSSTFYVTGNMGRGVPGTHHPTVLDPSQGYLNSTNSTCGSCSLPWQSKQIFTSNQKPVNTDIGRMPAMAYHKNPAYTNPQWTVGGLGDPLQNSQLLPYLTDLPPPPEYPGLKANSESQERKEFRRSYEMVEKAAAVDLTNARSQPDLTRFWDTHNPVNFQYLEQKSPAREEQITPVNRLDLDHIAARATHMVDIVSEENKQLREELNTYHKKVAKLEKFEIEIQKVHEAYESLVRSSQKREKLELMMKRRLEDEIRKLHMENKELKAKQENASLSSQSEHFSSTEQQKKDAAVSSLISQNKELKASNDRLELEFATQNMSLQDQRAQREILDNALANAQVNVVRLEEECLKKQMYMDQVEQLQKAFTSLQATCQKREHMEKQLRGRLEREVETLKASQKTNTLGNKCTDSRGEETLDTTSLTSLKQLLNEKEAKILQLETESVKWEQKYLEESTRRQLEMQDACAPSSKETKLAVYEQSSMDAEKLIDEAKTEKLRHMEEVYQANCRVAELEAKVKSLQAQLTEKDAMIRVFQRSPMTRSSSVHTLYCSPLHSPRPSLIGTGSLSRQGSQSDTSAYRDLGTIMHMKTGSTSAIETRRLSVDEEPKDKFLNLQTDQENAEENDESGKVWQV